MTCAASWPTGPSGAAGERRRAAVAVPPQPGGRGIAGGGVSVPAAGHERGDLLCRPRQRERRPRPEKTDRSRGRCAGQRRQLLEASWLRPAPSAYSGRGGQRFGTLEAIRKAVALARELERPESTFDELRNLAIAALALPDLHMLKEWEGWPEGSRGIVFDDTLQRYARLDSHGNITVRRVADDVEIAARSGEGPTVTLGGFDKGGRALILFDAAEKSRKCGASTPVNRSC